MEEDKKKKIDLNAAISIIARAMKELTEDLEDGFQVGDALDFIGNIARGFQRIYGGWILSLIANLCGK